MIWMLCGYMWLFIHRPFEIWPILGDLRLERLYMLTTILVWAFSPHSLNKNRLNMAFMAFVSVMLLSWIMHPELESKTVEEYLKQVVFFVLVISTVRNERDLKHLVGFFLIAMGIYMLHSLREYLNGRHFYRMGIARMIGVDSYFNDPNSFGATLVYALVLTFPFWLTCRTRRERAPVAGYTALTLLCVMLTGSRTAFASVIVLSGVATAIMPPLRRRWKSLAVAGALVAAFTWSMLPDYLQNRYLTLINPEYGPANAQESAESRSQGWRDGVRIWQENPVLGVGPGGFKKARGIDLESHHLYGQVLSELGTLGALAFTGMVVSFWLNARETRRLFRRYSRMPKTFSFHLAVSCWIAVVMLLFMGFGGHNLYRYNWLWFGAFQVVATCIARRQYLSYRAAVRQQDQWIYEPADSELESAVPVQPTAAASAPTTPE